MKKRGIKFYLSIYFKIIGQDIKGKLSYRADFILSTLGMIIQNIVGALTFWIMFQTFDNINGFSFHEIMFFYGFSLLALTPMQCMFDNNWTLRHQVYSGDFIKYCFRPINVFFYFMSEVFDIKGIGEFIIGLSVLIYAWAKLKIEVTVLTILLVFVLWISASLVMVSIMNLAAATCFWLQNTGYVMVTVFKFTDYAKYPANIFSKVFRIIFTFVIPIAFVAYYPSMAIIRSDNVPMLTWFTTPFAAVFFYLSYKVWVAGARRYNGTGS